MTKHEIEAQQIAQEFWAMIELKQQNLRLLLITILKSSSVRDIIYE